MAKDISPIGPRVTPVTASAVTSDGTDPLTVGRRVRHHRRARGLTLAEAAAAVGLSASAISLIENGKREAKLTVLAGLASAFGVELQALLTEQAPNKRAALEIELERSQRAPGFAALGVPAVRPGPRLPTEALESLVGLHRALAQVQDERAATPEHARRANARLRERMREADNHFPEIEDTVADLLVQAGYHGGPITRVTLDRIFDHLGFKIRFAADLPSSTRTVTDLANRRIYLPQPAAGQHSSRTLALQALGHVVLGHQVPSGYAEFLEQRVETNYFAAAVLVPRKPAVQLLSMAKADKDIAIEDLRDAFAVSYETAAHRFTNLATRHLDLPVHFMRISESGTIYKAYANDGVHFPADVTGAVEGQRVCRWWTARVVFDQSDLTRSYQQYTDTGSGTYWCTALVDSTSNGNFSVSVGVPYAQAKWMRGRDTTERSTSRCPDPDCCARPSGPLQERWAGKVWPSARAHSHLLAAMPPGVFPGVEDAEVVNFLERNASL